MKFKITFYSIGVLLAAITLLTTNILISQNQSESDTIIKIGLLITDNTSLEAQFAAEFAIREANKKSNIGNKQFRLVTRTMEGPWGKGSTEAVNLIFKEKVWAILGSHDGRNAHLVEQVIAKTGMVFMSAWASDPTLSQAFVPWYFSCVPNGNQQVDALIKGIHNQNKIATVSDDSYDANLILKSFLKKLNIDKRPDPLQLYVNNYKSFNYLINKINKEDINSIVLFAEASITQHFICELRKRRMNQRVLGTVSLLRDYHNLIQYNNIKAITSGNWLNSKELPYANAFHKKYNKTPGAVAAYAFDGINAIINAIKDSGYDRDGVKKAMSNTHYIGVTGILQFDNKGNRLDAAQLFEIN